MRLPVDEQHVFVDLAGNTAEAVLRDLVERLTRAPGAPRSPDMLAALLERERLGSTAVGDGVAIPHAKLAELRRPLLAVGTTAHDVDFDAPDGRPVRLLLLALSPAAAPAEHLRLLATISRWLSAKPSPVAALRTAESRARVLAILREDAA